MRAMNMLGQAEERVRASGYCCVARSMACVARQLAVCIQSLKQHVGVRTVLKDQVVRLLSVSQRGAVYISACISITYTGIASA